MWKWLALGSAGYGVAAMLLVVAPHHGGSPLDQPPFGPDGRQAREHGRGPDGGRRDGAPAPGQPGNLLDEPEGWPAGELRSAFDFEDAAQQPRFVTKPPAAVDVLATAQGNHILRWSLSPETGRMAVLAVGLHAPAGAQRLKLDLRLAEDANDPPRPPGTRPFPGQPGPPEQQRGGPAGAPPELLPPAAAPGKADAPDGAADEWYRPAGPPDAAGPSDRAPGQLDAPDRPGQAGRPEGGPEMHQRQFGRPRLWVGVRLKDGATYGVMQRASVDWTSLDLPFDQLRPAPRSRTRGERFDPQEISAVVVMVLRPARPEGLPPAPVELDNVRCE